MVRHLLLPLLLLALFAPARAQEEPSAPAEPRKVRKEYADHYQETTYHDRKGRVATVRSYYLDGTLFAEDHYAVRTVFDHTQMEPTQLVRHGSSRVWHRNGQVYVSCDYKDNQLNGPFQVFYESGAIKRREFYRSGRVRKSSCFTETGEETTCEPFSQEASFPGGTNGMIAYLRSRLNDSTQTNVQPQYFYAQLTINEIGQVVKVQPAQLTPNLPIRLYQALRDMPNWKPATVDGTPYLTQHTVALMWVRGVISLYNPVAARPRTPLQSTRRSQYGDMRTGDSFSTERSFWQSTGTMQGRIR